MVAMERRATCFGARAALYARSPWWTASPAVPVEPAAPQQREGVLTPSRMLAVDYFNPKHAAWRCAPALEPSARPAQRLSADQLSPLTHPRPPSPPQVVPRGMYLECALAVERGRRAGWSAGGARAAQAHASGAASSAAASSARGGARARGQRMAARRRHARWSAGGARAARANGSGGEERGLGARVRSAGRARSSVCAPRVCGVRLSVRRSRRSPALHQHHSLSSDY